jgi:hypothetical protein
VDVAADLQSITGAEVSAVMLDYRVSFQLIDPNEPLRLDAWLVLGVPFEYETEGQTVGVDPEQPRTLEAAWRWLRRRIVSVSADADLNLTIMFDDASRIAVQRHDAYEAWELHGKGVRGVLVGPR